jgi:ERCC4-type nuclease
MKFKFEDYTIIIDTREKRPWNFEGVRDMCELGTLKTGDYSLKGYEDCIAVERKSLADFVGSISTNRKRFTAEMERASKIKHFCVIVEGSYFDLFTGNYRSKLLPQSAIGSAIGIMARYGIPVIMAETREQAKKLCIKFLRLSLMREYKDKETKE